MFCEGFLPKEDKYKCTLIRQQLSTLKEELKKASTDISGHFRKILKMFFSIKWFFNFSCFCLLSSITL